MIDKFLTYFEPSIGNIGCIAPVIAFTIAASISDRRMLKIPDRLNIVFFLFRALVAFFYPMTWEHIAGFTFGFLIICIPAMIILLPMGGDAKFSAVLGFWIGFGGMVFSMIVGVTLFVAVAFIKKMGRKDKMALGPYISVGTWTLIALYYGLAVIRWLS